MRLWAVLLAGGVLLAGCTTPTPRAPSCRPWEASDSSTEPPSHCLFFPGSLAVDPLGDVLYATNTNADLTFGGSTLFAVDLLRQEHAVACFRRYGTAEIAASDPDDLGCGKISCSNSGASLGTGATVEQTERYEALSKNLPANFDRCYCQRDIDDPNIVNCEPQRFIISEQTIKLGFFPGEMRLLVEDPPLWTTAAPRGNLLHRGIYVAVRGDPSITFVDATRPLMLGRKPSDSPRVELNCSGVPRPDERPTSSRNPGDTYVLKECADQNRVQRTFDDVLIDMNNPALGTQPRFRLPAEPLGLTIARGCIEPGGIHERGTFYGGNQCSTPDCSACYTLDSMGKKIPGTYYQYLVATHLPNAQVSAFELPGNPTSPAPPVLQDVSVSLFSGSDMRRGAFAVAPRLAGDLSQPWYVTSRLTGQISTFRLATATGPRVIPGLILTVANQFSVSPDDVRDAAFEPSGDRAFFAVYTPPSLVVLDTRLRANGSGVPNNQVLSITNLCNGPSRLALARVPRQSMGATILSTHLFVTCYQSGQVAEVDADSGDLVGTIQVGRGPLNIALNFGAGGGIDPCADPFISDLEAKRLGVICPTTPPDLRPRPFGAAQPQLGPRAYVSTYTDSTIAVLDLDPRSPTYRRTIARIGLPSPKKVE